MDVEYLLGSVLRGVLTGRGGRKKTRGAMRYILGNRRAVGGGAMLLGGLALALYESLSKGSGVGASPAPMPSPTPAPTSAPPPIPGATPVRRAVESPPPLPGAAPVVPPPLPGAAAVTGGQTADEAVPPEVLRVIRLSISAARADGQFTAAEQDVIRQQARQAGAAALIEPDLRVARPVAEILAGVAGETQRQQLYSIAFAIVRADEQVTPSERVYLQQVAAALGLDEAMVGRLEQQVAAGIAEPGRS